MTLKNSSTCLDKGAAPENKRRIRPPNPCLIYQKLRYHFIKLNKKFAILMWKGKIANLIKYKPVQARRCFILPQALLQIPQFAVNELFISCKIGGKKKILQSLYQQKNNEGFKVTHTNCMHIGTMPFSMHLLMKF